MNRYHINFEERMLEPSEVGKWVKFDDVANLETEATHRAEQHMKETMKADHAQLKRLNEEVATLATSLELLAADTKREREELDSTIQRQRFLLKAAKDRLKLLGHGSNCSSRYGAITADGQQIVNECNCGLDEWLKESGVAHA